MVVDTFIQVTQRAIVLLLFFTFVNCYPRPQGLSPRRPLSGSSTNTITTEMSSAAGEDGTLSADTGVELLAPSKLGTKSYWEKAYRREVANFEGHGDEGEVWFGQEAMDRVMRWLERNRDELVPFDTSILDLGCGNGKACLELAAEGYKDVTGVDYCHEAIDLASKLAEKHKIDNVAFKQCDILSKPEELKLELKKDHYELVLDKGTFDAVSLNPDNAKEKMAVYSANVAHLLKSRGLFIITSCNWTSSELETHFNSKFSTHCIIPTPQFRFGGVVGNMVTSMVFRKKDHG